MSDQLRNGDFLRPVITQANDPSVWLRGPQVAFSGWIEVLDAWMRNQLVGALDAVRHKIEAYVRDFDNAQQAFANGIPGVALPPPPGPVGITPPNCPYPFHLERSPGRTNPAMNPDLMRRGLANSLGKAKEELHAFSRRLGDVLSEPAPAANAPVVPGAPPMRHLPPDAKEAAGVTAAYQAIEVELEKALQDVLDRAQTWEDAQAADESPSLGGGLLGLGLNDFRETLAKLEELAKPDDPLAPLPQTTLEAQAPAPVDSAPVTPPRTPEQQQEARDQADALVKRYPPKKVLDDPKKLEELANELKKHQNDPDFTAQFVKGFGPNNLIAVPRKLQAWQNGWKWGDHLLTYLPSEVEPKGLPEHKTEPKGTKEQIEGILYSFSATLATASRSGQLSEKTQDDIFDTKDPNGLSWLLTDPGAHFDAEFLTRAFDECVKGPIITAAGRRGQGAYLNDYPLYLPNSILSHDPKVATLEAISRNPEAALKLQREFEPFELRYGGGYGSRKIESLADLLYQGSNPGKGYPNPGYPDGGNCVAKTLNTLYDGLLERAKSDANAGLEAQKVLGDMVRSASTTTLPAGARQGLAKLLAGHMPNVAAIIHDPDNQLSAEFRVNEDFTADEVKSTLSEIAHDPTALATAMAGLGSFVGGTYDDFARQMAQQADPSKLDPDLVERFKNENRKIGTTFCEMARSVRAAGIKDREKAMSALASFRFGVDIVFDAVKKIPVVGAVEGGLNTATAGAAGAVTGKGEDALKDKVAGWLSGVDAEEEAAKSKALTRTNVSALNGIAFDTSMSAMGKQPLLLHALLAKEPAAKWPEAMMRQPHPPWPPQPAPTDPGHLRDYLLPQYLTADGGVAFPTPGDPAYHDYRSWCKQDWNTVAERAHTMSEAASEKMAQCMAESGWIDAA